jgi:hypothetical protein
VKLHGFLNHILSTRGILHEGLHRVITDLIYLPTLLNDHIRNGIKKFLISDCRIKMKALELEFNPDLLQVIYFDLVLLNQVANYGSMDEELSHLLMELAKINVAEVHLYLIRFCVEKGWDYRFHVQ